MKNFLRHKRFIIVLVAIILLTCALIGVVQLINHTLDNTKQDDNVIKATPPPYDTGDVLVEKKKTISDDSSTTVTQSINKRIIVLDAGHGKPSSQMSAEEKASAGYVQNNGVWGEWRHFKSGTSNVECEGSGCNQNRTCWYPISNGDRSTEPNVNLQNVLAAKKYLEGYGYEVRLTRLTNDENPAFTKRVSYCYPNCDMTAAPDADAYVCVHSNAGGGKGSAYITCGSNYDQKWIGANYASESNRLGQIINDCIVNETSISKCGTGSIGGEGWLILFNKCPVPVAYMEIGFFDNSGDLAILNSESDKIGKAIADGVNQYFSN